MSKSLLNKINQANFLSLLFSFLPRKKATRITSINKKLSSEMNLTIDEYLLGEAEYRKIILKSKGSVNEICINAFKSFNESDYNSIPFPELTKNMIKYMKYLYDIKVFKYYVINFDRFIFFHWSHVTFILEVLRTLKKGISIELCGNIKFKYYEMLKDAISNLEEVHSVSIYPIIQMAKNKLNSFKFYYDMLDWTKVRCIDLLKISKLHYTINELQKCILFPDNANFRKIKINDIGILNSRHFAPLMVKHGWHVEHLKIFNFRDTGVNPAFFSNLPNVKKVKLIQCSHLAFYNFLFIFMKYLSKIKILVLDNITEPEFKNLSEQKECFYIIHNVLPRLNNLEKLEINLNQISNISDTYKLLSKIVSQNKDLKELKIGLTIVNKNKPSTFMEKFIGKEANLEDENLKEFYNLIKEISSLKSLSNLELNFDMDDKMTQIVNTILNVGNNLKNLAMTHTNKLNVSQLFIAHPNLNIINLCLKDAEDTKAKFNYEFAQRPWKSITLKNYPLNNSFIDALIKAKNSLSDLTLENAFNDCEKPTAEVNNILLAIKNFQI